MPHVQARVSVRRLLQAILNLLRRSRAPARLPDPEFSSNVLLPEPEPAPAEVPAQPVAPIAVQAKKKVPIPRRRYVKFDAIVQRISDRYGPRAAAAWTQAVLNYQRDIDMIALESALASKNAQQVAAIVGPDRFQQALERAIRDALSGLVVAAGTTGASLLSRDGLTAVSFNAVHPNVVLYARNRAAELVVGIAEQTKQIIAEVIARGAGGLLTIEDQAMAIRELVGLPPGWMNAPNALAAEIRAGQAGAATSRRLSAVMKQQIRSRIANDTVTPTFIRTATESYSRSLINLRAHNIARTESIRASHFGLTEGWKQSQADGTLPDTTRQFWIVTPDDRLCPICVEIPGMNPDGVRIGEPFATPEGPVDYPPAPHPNCRCAIALAFGDATDPAAS